MDIQAILVPTDFSACAEAAFMYAQHLAHGTQAEVHLLHVAPILGVGTMRELSPEHRAAYAQLRDAADERMQALVEAHHSEGDRVRRVHSHGTPADVILGYCEAENIDLVVMGTRGHRVVRSMLLGSVAQEVVRHASCPVMTVPSPEDMLEGSLADGPILAPFDFSEHAEHGLVYAQALSRLYHTPLRVLYVVDAARQPEIHATGAQWDEDVREQTMQDLHDRLDDAVADVLSRVGEPYERVTSGVAVGYPPVTILDDAAAHEASLIVMASHGHAHGTSEGAFPVPLGSVTERIVRGAPCPVFVAKPYGRSLLAEAPPLARAHHA